MMERMKRIAFGVGVCFPIYFLLYGAVYVFERLALTPEQWAAGHWLYGAGIVFALRLVWMFGRAALTGRPVLSPTPELMKVEPILPIYADPASEADVQAEAERDESAAAPTEALTIGQLATDAQRS